MHSFSSTTEICVFCVCVCNSTNSYQSPRERVQSVCGEVARQRLLQNIIMLGWCSNGHVSQLWCSACHLQCWLLNCVGLLQAKIMLGRALQVVFSGSSCCCILECTDCRMCSRRSCHASSWLFVLHNSLLDMSARAQVQRWFRGVTSILDFRICEKNLDKIAKQGLLKNDIVVECMCVCATLWERFFPC